MRLVKRSVEKNGSSRWEWNPGPLVWASKALPLSYHYQTTTMHPSPHCPIFTAQVVLNASIVIPSRHSTRAVKTPFGVDW